MLWTHWNGLGDPQGVCGLYLENLYSRRTGWGLGVCEGSSLLEACNLMWPGGRLEAWARLRIWAEFPSGFAPRDFLFSNYIPFCPCGIYILVRKDSQWIKISQLYQLYHLTEVKKNKIEKGTEVGRSFCTLNGATTDLLQGLVWL